MGGPVPSPVLPAVEIPPVPILPVPTEAEDQATWSNIPSVKDQRARHPQTVRLTGLITEIFDLSDPAQFKKYNELQSAGGRHGDLKSTLIVKTDRIERNPITGKFDCVFQYAKYQFLKVIPDPKKS